MLALRQSLRLTAARRAPAAVRGYANGKTAQEIKEDKEGWTENHEDTESEANVTADRSCAPNKPNEQMVDETIDVIDGKHHGGKGEVKKGKK